MHLPARIMSRARREGEGVTRPWRGEDSTGEADRRSGFAQIVAEHGQELALAARFAHLVS